MPSSRELEPQLPYLRRFARALTGDVERGDACVEAALRRLMEEPDLLSDASTARVGLYRLLLTTCHAATHEGSHALPGERMLHRLTPASQQAFLLKALEGFELEQVAEVLAIGPVAATRLLESASREIARQLSTTILIIEDEPVIALDLEALVEGCGHQVTGIASTHREALELAGARPPGLVLADIQLADRSSGLDAVNDLLGQLQVPVIFITAYPERLLSGKRPEPTFVVTKPYSASNVLALISQALFFEQVARPRNRIVA